MPYKPNTVGERERSNQFVVLWFSVGGAVFSFANLFIGMDNMLSAVAFGSMAGGPLSVAFGTHADEYLQSLLKTGLRWMSAVLGVYLVALFILASGDVANELGYAFGGGGAQREAVGIEALAMNGLTVAIALTLAFYAGFAFQWLRDRWDASEDE
ncbi:hypothetical protein [Erythrobacter donghaensis]|uniref:hypothetical protein n=1 Tax=Erythrobacter donghaensis TaxID=267135 RepID=UPI000A3CFB54|nr:hypothetical protein [Erythrobacter donghaensis]